MHKFLKFIFGINFYMFRTVPLSVIRSLALYTQQWYMSYRFADSSVLILFASCQQTCMTYIIVVCTVLNSWWRTEELSETFRILFQKQILEISAYSWFYYKQVLSSSSLFLFQI